MVIKVVFFDLGETLICEDRLWARWAAYLNVPSAAFLAALDEIIAKGEHHRRVFDRFKPGFDVEAARRERAASGDTDVFDANDLYPDAIPCLRALRDRGYLIGIAGNQPAEAERAMRELGIEVDFTATSARWGVEKPSPAFFAKLTEVSGVLPSEIVHVGDRLDNDVLPARDAGMISVFLERGPWGRAHARRAEAGLADIWIKELAALPGALEDFIRTAAQ